MAASLSSHPSRKIRPIPGHLALLFSCALALSACTTSITHSGVPSTPISDLKGLLSGPEGASALAGRTQSQTIDRITVSACILPDGEAHRRYGVSLAKKGLQAVWLRVANMTTEENWLLAAFMEPDYFTADEAARLYRRSWGIGFGATQQRFRDLAMRARLEGGRTYEGHILVPRTEGGRFVEVTLNGSGRVRRFGLPLRTPDGHFDFEKMDTDSIQKKQKPINLTRAQLRTRLEQLPATVTNAQGTHTGDPLNIVLVGQPAQVMAALSECGWAFTHRIDSTTVRRMIGAALSGQPYLNAPVSNLYCFGRAQDIAFQRARSHLSQRNHMRLWLAPYTVEGRPVWVGQISRDIGIKITRSSPTLTTHVIDPMVDEARQFLLESLLFRFRIESFGFVRASSPATREHPRVNLTGDPYITDGMRLITFISSEPVPAEKVRNLGWGKTTHGPIEFGQSVDTALLQPTASPPPSPATILPRRKAQTDAR